MKNLFSFIAASAVLIVCSCSREPLLPEASDASCPEGYYVEEIVADYPRNPDTRTAFNEVTGRFAWSQGDELAFHLSNGEYTVAEIDPATSKVKLYLPIGVTRNNYAVYPASAVVSEAAVQGNMKVTLPNSYDISSDLMSDYVPTPLVAMNDADNRHLKFEHVGALLQVNLNVPAGVKTATVSLGKKITGEFTLQDGSGNGIIAPGSGSSDQVEFILSSGGLSDGTQAKLLVPVPAGQYEAFKVSYDDGYTFTKDLSSNPWVFGRSEGKKVTISEDSFEDPTNYFWLEALEANSTVYVTPNGDSGVFQMEYSVDGKKTWTEYDIVECPTITLSEVGDRVYFRGLSNYSASSSIYRTFNGTGKLKTGGELILLCDYQNPSHGSYGYKNLFAHNEALIDASELVFPDAAYGDEFYMTFYDCKNLVKGPAVLPALNAMGGCYISMFNGCSSLLEAPELPATKVGSWSYYAMFYQCTALEKGPSQIIATESNLANKAFYAMFYNCRELKNAPVMAFGKSTRSSSTEACYQMFYNCKSIKTVTMTGPEGVIAQNGMREMFYSCSSLETVDITLPATEVYTRGYQGMFEYCTSLTNCPEVIPATTLGEMACANMFSHCSSLLHGPEIEATTVSRQSCIWMFEYCTSMTSAASILPATTLASQCYSGMFANCWALTTAPVLPATTLASYCYGNYAQYYDGGRTGDPDTRYGGMFANCKALTVAPELPATQLALGCYYGMFHGCSALVKAPDLPAETVYDDGYFRMFEDCTSLTEASLAATTFPYEGTAYRRGGSRMFYGCTSLQKLTVNFTAWGKCPDWVTGVPAGGMFYKPEALPENYGVSYIPEGWSVTNL